MAKDASRRETILVVDDNRDICLFAKRFLESAGWTVLMAPDGEQGLRFYEEHQASIVLLLTDVSMPKMNGIELADRVRRIDSKLPVLFMSGDEGGAHRDLGYLPKPFLLSELVEKVSRVLQPKAHSETEA
jgi:two-component system, cell cycle sensor histidine kinase and response regulator CckA